MPAPDPRLSSVTRGGTGVGPFDIASSTPRSWWRDIRNRVRPRTKVSPAVRMGGLDLHIRGKCSPRDSATVLRRTL